VVARVEALIAGLGHEEAIKRAEAYRVAGADAILIHSKIDNSSEIEKFLLEWNRRSPVVIVPTMYYNTPTDKFREWGVNLVIWANHNMRASITAM
jgi:phosphoenolpyruvate phosphomutase